MSAWRKTRNSPWAARAPIFICWARPGGECITLAPNDLATLVVLSWLPPSTTMSSIPLEYCALANARRINSASLRVGIITEMGWDGLFIP